MRKNDLRFILVSFVGYCNSIGNIADIEKNILHNLKKDL